MSADGDPIRIVLADDHAVVRSGLRFVLDHEAGLEVVAEAGDLAETLRKVRAIRPHVLVLDLNMGGESSLASIPTLRADVPDTAIVVLTMQDEPGFAREALRSGACAYVLKEAAGYELVAAVRAGAHGETYVSPSLGARLAAEPPAPAGPPDDLTDREVEVLRLIALGNTNAEIAQQLYISVRTVESHRAHIQQKVDRMTRAELVAYAIERGLIGT
jgi:two-component system response regulator NreC